MRVSDTQHNQPPQPRSPTIPSRSRHEKKKQKIEIVYIWSLVNNYREDCCEMLNKEKAYIWRYTGLPPNGNKAAIKTHASQCCSLNLWSKHRAQATTTVTLAWAVRRRVTRRRRRKQVSVSTNTLCKSSRQQSPCTHSSTHITTSCRRYHR